MCVHQDHTTPSGLANHTATYAGSSLTVCFWAYRPSASLVVVISAARVTTGDAAKFGATPSPALRRCGVARELPGCVGAGRPEPP
jgi:hypothetical protein